MRRVMHQVHALEPAEQSSQLRSLVKQNVKLMVKNHERVKRQREWEGMYPATHIPESGDEEQANWGNDRKRKADKQFLWIEGSLKLGRTVPVVDSVMLPFTMSVESLHPALHLLVPPSVA
jgi:hypothetical protein